MAKQTTISASKESATMLKAISMVKSAIPRGILEVALVDYITGTRCSEAERGRIVQILTSVSIMGQLDWSAQFGLGASTAVPTAQPSSEEPLGVPAASAAPDEASTTTSDDALKEIGLVEDREPPSEEPERDEPEDFSDILAGIDA